MVVRAPAVAGRFYPPDPRELAETVSRFMADPSATRSTLTTSRIPKGLIVPHAGYVYSGSVAGHVYSLLEPVRNKIRRVVLIGPSHHVPFVGIGTTSADAFETPLGPIPIDREINEELLRFPFITTRDDVHTPEHSLEVQLPFLKQCLDDFSLVPLVYGRVAPEQIAQILRHVWGGPETLIVVSSDLSHFLEESDCRRVDAETAKIIESLETDRLTSERACGALGIQGLMILAREQGLQLTKLELKNSGEVSGDFDRVVGYGGFFLTAPQYIEPKQNRSALDFRTN